MSWADEVARLQVMSRRYARRTRAKRSSWALQASASAAPSTCSMQPDRLRVLRQYDHQAIPPQARAEALNQLLPFQRDDFGGILEAYGRTSPVTIRCRSAAA